MRFSARRLPALAVALCLAGATFVGLGGTASAATAPTDTAASTAPPIPIVFFQIRAQHSDKCLDVTGVSQANGAIAQQWDCLGPTQLNQLWRLEDTGDGVTYYVKALHSGKCLDVSGVSLADGALVQQWDCLGYNQANQRWHIDFLSGNFYRMRPAHNPSRCLDVRGGTGATANGVPTQQWICLGAAQTNQNWRFLSS